MRTIWKYKGSRRWLITTSILVPLMLTIFLLATQVSLFFGTLNLVLGGYRYVAEKNTTQYYQSQYASKEESVAAGLELSEDMVKDGVVLLKNELVGTAPALPLAEGAKVSVFGKNSVNMVYGGSGSGERSKDDVVDLYSALTSVGFEYNPSLKSFYQDNSKSGNSRPGTPAMGTILAGFAIGETPVDKYDSSITSTYSEYSDAAIIVLTRIAGEGYDLPRTMKTSWSSDNPVPGARSATDHYLQLDQNETDLIKHVCENENFDRVIILLNSGSAMELGFLDDETHYAYHEKIKAALWIGNPGGTGNRAVAKILAGEVNPSGRLPDTYARDFKADPTWQNFGNNLVEDGDKYYIRQWGTSAVNSGAYFVRYEEGIYIGYRYYETRGYTSSLSQQGDTPDWYDKHVVYPFGYGLSYTSFSWTLKSQSPANAAVLSKDGTISVTVTVTNTGSVAGKDVVELYYTAPYIPGEIEKSHVTLGGFAKTGIIQPGASQDVTIELKVSDMASYDWNDANKNGHKGYELDPGTYTIRLSKNAHDSVIDLNYSISEVINYDHATNKFDDVSNHINKYLSRNDWVNTFPTNPVKENRNESYNVFQNNATSQAFFKPFSSHTVNDTYDVGKPWYTEEMPTQGKSGDLELKDLLTQSTDPVTGKTVWSVSYDDPRWEQILDQLTIEDMKTLVGIGAFSTVDIEKIGKPETQDYDGPGGFVVGSFMSLFGSDVKVTFFPAESLIAATWNLELARKMGEMIGDEGIWGGYKGGIKRTFSGWYAPAVNIHRSQFGGRNFEYYSEDGLLTGLLAAEVVLGAKSNGTYTFVKHFALNEQETNRSSNGYAAWANEQSMREIYFKGFELAVTKGKSTGMMSSFNRIGTEWTGASYNLLTGLLRDEWGFQGMVITDYNGPAYMNLDKMIRGGGDLNLFQSIPAGSFTAEMNATQVAALRKASKNILYTVVNSNAMNTLTKAKLMPLWELYMIITFSTVTAGLGVWGFFKVRKAFKLKKEEEAKEVKS